MQKKKLKKSWDPQMYSRCKNSRWKNKKPKWITKGKRPERNEEKETISEGTKGEIVDMSKLSKKAGRLLQCLLPMMLEEDHK